MTTGTPREFADMPPVNPRDRERPERRFWRDAEGLAADVRYYGKWVEDEAEKRIGHLYEAAPYPPAVDGASGPRGSAQDRAPRQAAALAAFSDAVSRVGPHLIHDMIDHYSTGSSSPYATVERDIAAYARLVVAILSNALGRAERAWSTPTTRRSDLGAVGDNPFGDAPGSWAWCLEASVVEYGADGGMRDGTPSGL